MPHKEIISGCSTSLSSPKPTIILTCSRYRELWPDQFSEHAQSICFIFSVNHICQICKSWTSSVGQSQSSRSLPQVRRIVALGTRMQLHLMAKTTMTITGQQSEYFCNQRTIPTCKKASRTQFLELVSTKKFSSVFPLL